jgi:hypothetical protein
MDIPELGELEFRLPSRLQASIPLMISICRAYGYTAEQARVASSATRHAFVASRQIVYLDMNWWVWLRDARFDSSTDSRNREILKRLTHLVHELRVVCPA